MTNPCSHTIVQELWSEIWWDPVLVYWILWADLAVPGLINYSGCAADPIKAPRTLGRDLQRWLFSRDCTYGNLFSFLPLCYPIYKWKWLLRSQFSLYFFPRRCEISTRRNPTVAGSEAWSLPSRLPHQEGEQGVSEAGRILPPLTCLGQSQKKRKLVEQYRVHVYKWIPPERCRYTVVLSKMCILALLTVMLKIWSTAFITLNSKAQMGQRV